MEWAAELLVEIREITKSYESILKVVCEKYGLTAIEGKIVSFLCNNPGKDTAAEIAELRMLSKGNVSQAVESLLRRGFLRRTPDTGDRRKVHLSLLPETEKITGELEEAWKKFYLRLFDGFSAEEMEKYGEFRERMMRNIRDFDGEAHHESRND